MKRIFLNVIIRFNRHEVPALASQLAYNLILSFFPFLIFLMTLIGHTSLDGIEVLTELSRILPQSVFMLIKSTVLDVVNTKSSSLMSFSLIFTLWSASSGFNAVIKGLNKAYGIRETRSFVKVRIISLLCTLGMAFIIIMMALMLVFSRIIWNTINHHFHLPVGFMFLWIFLRYIIIVSTAIFIFSALYRYAPSRKLAWEEVHNGSIFSTFSIISVSVLFAYYVNNFGNYSVIYGSIGAIIILLIWLFLVSIIVLLGGEINASLISKDYIPRDESSKITNLRKK